MDLDAWAGAYSESLLLQHWPLWHHQAEQKGADAVRVCSYQNHCMTNVFISTKLNHRVSWSSKQFQDARWKTQIGKAASVLDHLTNRVWDNIMPTKMKVYQACLLSMLLYESKHRQCILAKNADSTHWGYWVSTLERILKNNILAQAGKPTRFALLTQRCLSWLCHASNRKDG